jgi:hypothetical protein
MTNPRLGSRVSVQADILRAQHRTVVGAEARRPYDNMDLQELLARLAGDSVGAEDRRPYSNVEVERQSFGELYGQGQPDAESSFGLPVADRAGHPSGFLERLIAERLFGPGLYTQTHKNVTASHFGGEREETTITWGQTVDLSIPGGVTTVSLAQVGVKQTVHVSRANPTSFTVLSQVALGAGWTGNPAELITILFTYIIGVGQTKVNVQRSLSSGASPFAGQIISDVVTLPLMSLQGTATIQAVNLGTETTPLSVSATSMVAPVVM